MKNRIIHRYDSTSGSYLARIETNDPGFVLNAQQDILEGDLPDEVRPNPGYFRRLRGSFQSLSPQERAAVASRRTMPPLPPRPLPPTTPVPPVPDNKPT